MKKYWMQVLSLAIVVSISMISCSEGNDSVQNITGTNQTIAKYESNSGGSHFTETDVPLQRPCGICMPPVPVLNWWDCFNIHLMSSLNGQSRTVAPLNFICIDDNGPNSVVAKGFWIQVDGSRYDVYNHTINLTPIDGRNWFDFNWEISNSGLPICTVTGRSIQFSSNYYTDLSYLLNEYIQIKLTAKYNDDHHDFDKMSTSGKTNHTELDPSGTVTKSFNLYLAVDRQWINEY